ncbi:MAG: aminomethyl-transferring glycine dehydrogenase subunit GcvPA [Terriglobia bacterium]
MRYLPNSPADRAAMLEATGHRSVDELFEQIPDELKVHGPLNLPGPLAESEIVEFFRAAASQSARKHASFLGAGAYSHYRPVVVDSLLSRGEFFTAYTPYQAELAQGTLQAMFEFQTLIAQLTGMDVSNASLYDGSTSTTEAVLMALRITRRQEVLVARTLHPEYRQVLATYVQHQGIAVREIPYGGSGQVDLDQLSAALTPRVAAVVIQSPNFLGALEQVRQVSELTHRNQSLLIVTVTEPLSLAITQPPGEADIVCGEAQSFGVPVAFGGPYVGFLGCREKFLRQMPGRLIGQTADTEGRRGFVLTLATREQHIRREKATSNICTNQSLCALTATIYLCLLGKQSALPFSAPFFNEFVVRTPGDSHELLAALEAQQILGGLDLERFYPELKNHLLVCATETVSRTVIDRMAAVYQSAAGGASAQAVGAGRNTSS